MISANAAPIGLDIPAEMPLPTLDEIRQEHIRSEANLKSLGILYLLSSILGGIGFTSIAVTQLTSGSAFKLEADLIMQHALSLCILLFMFALGLGLRKLQPNAKTPAQVFSCLGVFMFPVGTIFHGAALIFLFSKKAKFVLSDGYLEIIELTPNVKAGTSILVKIILAIALVLTIATVGLLFWAVLFHS